MDESTGSHAGVVDGPNADEMPVIEDPLDAAIRERDELKALVQRVQADFVNYRNRVSAERDEIRRAATGRLALRVLNTVDQLDTALGAERPDDVNQSWLDGFDGIRRGLLQVLSSEGIEAFASEGDPFDPRYHEALLSTESEEVPANTVVNVLRKGYKMGDDVIRAAQVQISKAPAGPPQAQTVDG
ncbi:MAG: nucleotide exchange factor GrpE [Chloroflexi bacterium]|nr:nucleotide exchange factor GrpE [Chloroflexota bacterium]